MVFYSQHITTFTLFCLTAFCFPVFANPIPKNEKVGLEITTLSELLNPETNILIENIPDNENCNFVSLIEQC